MKFRYDWFSHNIPHLKDILIRFKDRPTTALELGSYEGLSASWYLKEILTHPDSKLTCVDIWHDDIAESNFDANMKNFNDRVIKIKSKTETMLKKCNSVFDFIYIDASHHGYDVLTDSVLAWGILAKKGVLIWDDYEWNHPKGVNEPAPKLAIDAFLHIWRNKYEILHKGYQVVIRKL